MIPYIGGWFKFCCARFVLGCLKTGNPCIVIPAKAGIQRWCRAGRISPFEKWGLRGISKQQPPSVIKSIPLP